MRDIIFNPNKIKTTILLDLNEVDLYIWEQRKSFQDIQQKLEELISGKDFLPIPLGKIDEKKYFLHPYIINKQNKKKKIIIKKKKKNYKKIKKKLILK